MTQLLEPGDPKWSQFLASTRHDVFHVPGYAALYNQAADERERALYVQGNGFELLMPLVVRPLPELGNHQLAGWQDATSPYGLPGPLLRGSLPAPSVDGLATEILETLREHRIVSCFVRAHPLFTAADVLLEKLGVVQHGETVVIDLTPSVEQISNGVRAPYRRCIRRLREQSYLVELDQWSRMGDFISAYHQTMKRVGATDFYFFDQQYFDNLRGLLKEKLHLVAVLAPNGDFACGGLFTDCGGIVNLHLTGTNSAYLEQAPSKLMFDATWRLVKTAGAQVLHLGGGLGGKTDSLFHFKAGFSSQRAAYKTVQVVCDVAQYQAACRARGPIADDEQGFFPAYRRQDVPVAPAVPRAPDSSPPDVVGGETAEPPRSLAV